jgi:hypothetical protein
MGVKYLGNTTEYLSQSTGDNPVILRIDIRSNAEISTQYKLYHGAEKPHAHHNNYECRA